MKCGLKRVCVKRMTRGRDWKKMTEVVKMAFEGMGMNKTSASVSRDKRWAGMVLSQRSSAHLGMNDPESY